MNAEQMVLGAFASGLLDEVVRLIIVKPSARAAFWGRAGWTGSSWVITVAGVPTWRRICLHELAHIVLHHTERRAVPASVLTADAAAILGMAFASMQPVGARNNEQEQAAEEWARATEARYGDILTAIAERLAEHTNDGR